MDSARRPRGLLSLVTDGYANLMSRLGTSVDRATAGSYYLRPLSQAEIEAAYRTSWLTRKVHDLPPYEMTREGRDWQADAADIEKLEAAEIALKLWPKLREALTTARLHGGSAIILGVVGAGTPEQPLDPERVRANALRYVHVVSRHHLHVPFGFDTDPESDYFGTPSMWQMRGAKGNSVNIHPSRVVTFHGAPLPPASVAVSQLDQFWGDPLLQSVKTAIDNAESSQAGVATLIHEMKQDVVSIPGLTDLLATQDGENILASRISGMQQMKGMFGALLLDGGDGTKEGNGGEKWETRQLSFAQMPELLRQFIGIVAGAADIPVTRLLGEAPGGLNSTGKGEQQDFNRMIAARQTAELAPALSRIDAVLIPSALGNRPDEIYSEFAPLEASDPKAAAEIDKLETETIEAHNRMGLIPRDALAKTAYNRMIESGRYPGLDTAVEESPDELGESPEPATPEAPVAANENAVQNMERKGVVTADQALTLLADAAPRPLYVQRKLLNGGDVLAWAKAQGIPGLEAADELHVTVAYSTSPVDWMKAGDDWAGGDENGELRVGPGGPRLVQRLGDKGATVLLFASSPLTWRHEQIVRAGASYPFPEYMPHVTIAYDVPADFDLEAVEPYRGVLRFGPEIFEDLDA